MKLKVLLAASAFALMGSAGGASAYVACNHEGDCWHTDERTRAPGVTFQIHPDDWYFHRHGTVTASIIGVSIAMAAVTGAMVSGSRSNQVQVSALPPCDT